MLSQQEAYIDNFYYCPHHPTEGDRTLPARFATVAKPAPGMLLQAAQDLDIDLKKSYLVGDRFNDMEAAKKAGVRGVLVKTGYGQGIIAG